MKIKKIVILALLLFMAIPVSFASTDEDVNYILARPQAPEGVVFEIVEGDEGFLAWAIPQINKYAKKLREKFPGLNIAVVSHGKEEFALLKSNEKKYASIHKGVKQLVNEQDIPVHVCGTHASWYGHEDEDFPKFVDVAPVGPAQITDYENMGYTLVIVDKP